jgi:lipoate-protein ligase B
MNYQRDLVEKYVMGQDSEAVLLLQHEPVFTAGRREKGFAERAAPHLSHLNVPLVDVPLISS